MTKTNTTTGDLNVLLANINAAIASYLGVDGTVTVVPAKAEAAEESAKPAAKKATAKSKDKTEAPAKDEKGRRKQLAKMDDDALRALVIGYDYDPSEVEDADTDDLVDAILSEEFPAADDAEEAEDEAEDDEEEDEAEDEDEDEADEEDEDEEDEEDEDEEESYTRDELEAMSLREVKALAKDAGYAASDLKNLDQDGIVDLLLGDNDEEEEEDEDETEEEEESSDEWYTEDELKAMDLPDLKELAAEYEVEWEGRASKPKLVAALLDV